MGPIIPRHVFSVDGDGELISLDFSSKEFADGFNVHWANRTMCGTGPLRIEDWRRNERLSLARNADYWGEPFHFKRLVFVCEPNSFSLLQKLLHQELDWADIDQKDLYLQNRIIRRWKQAGWCSRSTTIPGIATWATTCDVPCCATSSCVRALTQAIPVEQIIQVVFNGLATQVTGPFANQSKAYDQSIEPLPFDLAASRKLLDQAGWIDSNHNGTRDKIIDGQRVEAVLNLTIEANSAQYLSVAQIVQTHWRQIGRPGRHHAGAAGPDDATDASQGLRRGTVRLVAGVARGSVQHVVQRQRGPAGHIEHDRLRESRGGQARHRTPRHVRQAEAARDLSSRSSTDLRRSTVHILVL